ncbi:hypothetical protein ACU4GD_17075 [Cupriavidus basilensis]
MSWTFLPVCRRNTASPGARYRADANQGGREIDAFLEGPVFDSAGNLLCHRYPLRPRLSHRSNGRVGAGGPVGRRAQRHEVSQRGRTAGDGLPQWPDAA